MDGILIVNKPKGLTSRDVVNILNKKFHTKKIGHTGTLDPMATGVLVCLIGKYTKLSNVITSDKKEYEASFDLGYLTDTLDNEGIKTNTNDKECSEEEIKRAVDSFKKSYMQEVPKYSAVKINGKKLYEYARNNEDINLPKREVTIYDIEYLGNNSFKCLVSKGTYIRSLIRDIGLTLNTYATMTSLKRTKQGTFDIKDSYTLEEIENDKYKLINAEDIFNTITLNKDEYIRASNGVKLKFDIKDDIVCLKYKENNVCLYKKDGDYYKMLLKF